MSVPSSADVTRRSAHGSAGVKNSSAQSSAGVREESARNSVMSSGVNKGSARSSAGVKKGSAHSSAAGARKGRISAMLSKDSMGSARSTGSAMGGTADDVELLHVPVGEEDEVNEEEDEEEDEDEEDEMMDTVLSDDAGTLGYSAFARKNQNAEKSPFMSGPSDWLNLPKIRKKIRKKKGILRAICAQFAAGVSETIEMFHPFSVFLWSLFSKEDD